MFKFQSRLCRCQILCHTICLLKLCYLPFWFSVQLLYFHRSCPCSPVLWLTRHWSPDWQNMGQARQLHLTGRTGQCILNPGIEDCLKDLQAFGSSKHVIFFSKLSRGLTLGIKFLNNSITNTTFCLVQLKQEKIWLKTIIDSLDLYLDHPNS